MFGTLFLYIQVDTGMCTHGQHPGRWPHCYTDYLDSHQYLWINRSLVIKSATNIVFERLQLVSKNMGEQFITLFVYISNIYKGIIYNDRLHQHSSFTSKRINKNTLNIHDWIVFKCVSLSLLMFSHFRVIYLLGRSV